MTDGRGGGGEGVRGVWATVGVRVRPEIENCGLISQPPTPQLTPPTFLRNIVDHMPTNQEKINVFIRRIYKEETNLYSICTVYHGPRKRRL